MCRGSVEGLAFISNWDNYSNNVTLFILMGRPFGKYWSMPHIFFHPHCKILQFSHRKIFEGNQTIFFGNGIVTIEMFEKKMFQIICHMMGCATTHKANMGRGVGVAFVVHRSFALLAWPVVTPYQVTPRFSEDPKQSFGVLISKKNLLSFDFFIYTVWFC